jgi:hypothetical protein
MLWLTIGTWALTVMSLIGTALNVKKVKYCFYNSGSSTIRPRRFITKAVKQLKGLDDRAAKRFEDKTKNIE